MPFSDSYHNRSEHGCFYDFPTSIVSQYKQTRKRITLIIKSSSSDNTSSPNAGDTKPTNGSLLKTRKNILLEYVQNVQPEFMELLVKRAPQQVVDAMRQTVTNMIGTLPPQFFVVTVTTVAENLAQLMYNVLMTGYMFRNAQYRLELQQSVEQVALPEPQDNKDVPDYAPGTQKKVKGEVIRWNNISGPEKIEAVKYIELLEAEIEELSRQMSRKFANGPNELLEYLKSLEPQNLKFSSRFESSEDLMHCVENDLKFSVQVSGDSLGSFDIFKKHDELNGSSVKLESAYELKSSDPKNFTETEMDETVSEFMKTYCVEKPSVSVQYTCSDNNSYVNHVGQLGILNSFDKKREKLDWFNSQESEVVETVSLDSSKRKKHECAVCFVVFSSGQALGGHKRAHYKGGVTECKFEEVTGVNQGVVGIKDLFVDLNFPANDGSTNAEEADCVINKKVPVFQIS